MQVFHFFCLYTICTTPFKMFIFLFSACQLSSQKEKDLLSTKILGEGIYTPCTPRLRLWGELYLFAAVYKEKKQSCFRPEQAQRVDTGIALPFRDLGAGRGCVVSIRPRPLYPTRKTRYPLYRRLGGPQGRSGRVRKISPPPGFHPGPSTP
jgi:hypothetical protein